MVVVNTYKTTDYKQIISIMRGEQPPPHHFNTQLLMTEFLKFILTKPQLVVDKPWLCMHGVLLWQACIINQILTRLNRLHTCWVYLHLDLSWLLAWYKKSLELDQYNIIFAIQSQKIDDNDNQYSYSESMQFTFLFPCHISYTPFIPSSPRQTDRGIPIILY